MSQPYLFVTRLFSGLFETVRSGVWKPTGIPTVTRLVSALAQERRVVWVVTCKTSAENAVIQGLPARRTIGGADVRLLPFAHSLPSTKADAVLNDLRHAAAIRRVVREERPALAWCDRSNVLSAAMIRRMGVPTVLRVLGVYPDQKALAERLSARLFSPLMALAYRAPFDLCVCSQDGSGVEYYLDRLLARKTPRITLLNGTDGVGLAVAGQAEATDRLNVLHVGKLTEDKGVPDLVEAAALLHRQGAGVRIVLAGKGPLREAIEARIATEGMAETLRLAGSVPHAEMQALYAGADVVVSLNRLGNLSNVVLEAMAAGRCLLMLEHDPATHTDEFTHAAVPLDVAPRIARAGTATDLAGWLARLARDRETVAAYAARMREFAPGFLWSWEERIGCEAALLDALAQGRDIAPLLAQAPGGCGG